jgi:hypothetical protein
MCELAFNVREPGQISQYSALAVNLMTQGRGVIPVSVKRFFSEVPTLALGPTPTAVEWVTVSKVAWVWI